MRVASSRWSAFAAGREGEAMVVRSFKRETRNHATPHKAAMEVRAGRSRAMLDRKLTLRLRAELLSTSRP